MQKRFKDLKVGDRFTMDGQNARKRSSTEAQVVGKGIVYVDAKKLVEFGKSEARVFAGPGRCKVCGQTEARGAMFTTLPRERCICDDCA